jgi:hypothetical protein
MKKITQLSILLIITSLIFNSCSKFEEGPAISLRSKKARLENTWEIEKIIDSKGNTATISDIFDTDSISEIIGFDIEIISQKFTFTKDGDVEHILEIKLNGAPVTTEISMTGTWEFIDETGLKITMDANTTAGIPSSVEEYNILKLANKELWLEYNFYGEIFEIHLIAEE